MPGSGDQGIIQGIVGIFLERRRPCAAGNFGIGSHDDSTNKVLCNEEAGNGARPVKRTRFQAADRVGGRFLRNGYLRHIFPSRKSGGVGKGGESRESRGGTRSI